jgi:hypothetical protein
MQHLAPPIQLAIKIDHERDALDKLLVLWLMEPLTLKHSLGSIRRMIQIARSSVLITTYEALTADLPGCQATILAHDTSPQTRTKILHHLLPKNTRGQSSKIDPRPA